MRQRRYCRRLSAGRDRPARQGWLGSLSRPTGYKDGVERPADHRRSRLDCRPVRGLSQVYCRSIPALEAALPPGYSRFLRLRQTRAISEGPTLMKQTARSWRVTVAGLAVGAAGVLGLASPTASADPVFPPRPNPAPLAGCKPAPPGGSGSGSSPPSPSSSSASASTASWS